MDDDSQPGVTPVRRWGRLATWVTAAVGLLAFIVVAVSVLQQSREEPQAASGISAVPAEAGDAQCDPATINRNNPAAGGIGPDCKYHPPIVMPPREGRVVRSRP